MGGSWAARPPFRSGAPPCAAPRLRPRVAPVRSSGPACRPRPPREQAAGGAGARGVQAQPHPSPPRRGPLWGRGGVLSTPEGWRFAPVASKLRGGGEGGVGGPPPAPPPRSASACLLLSLACHPGVYSCRGGCWAAAGVGRGPVGRQWVSAAGGSPPPWFAPQSSPGRPLKGPLRLRRPGRRRSAVGRQRAGRPGACLGRGARRPKPNPNHEHHRQPTLEGQHHKPCPNTPTQDPSQDWRG